jgi:hypothetical protein
MPASAGAAVSTQMDSAPAPRAPLATDPAMVFGRKEINTLSTSKITTKDGTEIFYKDWGAGQPVVFSHGWPLNADAWDEQILLVGLQRLPRDRP